MSVSIDVLLFVLVILFYCFLILVARILSNKFATLEELYEQNHRRLTLILSLISHTFIGSFESLRIIKEIKQSIILESQELELQTKELLKIEAHEIRMLKSHRSSVRRKEACAYLGLIGSQRARLALEEALPSENDYSVKIYISNALTDILNPESLPHMISALIGTHKWYKTRAISNILEFNSAIYPLVDFLYESKEMEHLELLIEFAGENIHPRLKQILFDFVDYFPEKVEEFEKHYESRNDSEKREYQKKYLKADMEGLLGATCRILANFYYGDLAVEKYFNHRIGVVKTNAYWAAAKQLTTEHFNLLLSRMHEEEYHRALIGALTQMVDRNTRFLYLVEDVFHKATDPILKSCYAQILSNKIEYYILQLNTKRAPFAMEILKAIILNNKVNELIGFINKNKNVDLENSLLELLKNTIKPEHPLAEEFRAYLHPHLVEKMGLLEHVPPEAEKRNQKDPNLIRVVIGLTLVTVLVFPIYYLFRYTDLIFEGGLRTNLKQYVIDFNYYIAFYSLAINSSYLVLLGLSYINMRKQAKLWNLKNISMLFRNRMIPSISIIAPAYNEEKSIIGSANSLLNLKYPNYELIIVNDGSRDETLNRLIEAFELVRVDYAYSPSLSTAPIRGVYRNRSIPKLIVVDKSNGGKADSLNAGINIANKEYFCGIDADSLLETEALLKLASLTLDESTETPALGGNIFPLNGCEVEKGLLTKIQIPKNHLARFQTIEYIRAFMAGRLGWQQINSLLIISGAFGLFRRERIIGIGGYLTSKGKYKKDTVGEDMELIVRISRLMHESKQHFKILYAFNANCWTEVPEDLKSLRGQRYRWHRGLIDILYFHRKMLFNRAYGNTGLVALPYYLIFEAIGPMIEIQGYIMVLLAAVLGILDVRLAILLFISTIMLGIIVSLMSLLIAERESNYFSVKDLMKLIAYAFIENFGPRQVFSFWRILGQFKVIFGAQGWGQIKRKGI